MQYEPATRPISDQHGHRHSASALDRSHAVLGLLCHSFLLVLLIASANGQSSVRGWGSIVFDSDWSDATDFVQVECGALHTVALRADGSVVAWGDNAYGQCDVPALPAGLTYVEVAASMTHSAARRSDGSVICWGWNLLGQCTVPVLPTFLENASDRSPVPPAMSST